ncbi:unnamed protein product, partial [Medioppia subpectinata]
MMIRHNNEILLTSKALIYYRFYDEIFYPIYEFVRPNKNGWFELMEILAKNESDMSLTPIVPSYERQQLFDFSKIIFFSSYVILSQSHKYESNSNILDHLGYIQWDTFHNQIWALIEDNKKVSLRVVPDKVGKETVGFNGVFFDHLKRGRIALFEPDYLTEFVKDVYCRRVEDMQWHLSPPIDVTPIRFAFGFSKSFKKTTFINNIVQNLISNGLINRWFLSSSSVAE